jgi:protein O-GlcNAc transferase
MVKSVQQSLRKAQIFLKNGELSKAEIIYKQILEKFPKNKNAILGYQKLVLGNRAGVFHSSEGIQEHFKELIHLYNLQNFELVLSKINKIIGLFPNAYELFNLQGVCNAALQRHSSAIDNYKQAIKIKPNYAEVYYNMGISQQNQSDLAVAINSYKQAIKIKPDYVDAYYNMGTAFRVQGDLAASINSYKQAIQIKPDYADAYYNMGISLKDQGDLAAAIDSYKQVLKINPDYADAYLNMGTAFRVQGDLAASINSYKQAIQIKPDYADAYYNMGISLKDQGDLAAAIDSYKHVLKINPDYADAYLNMGNSLRDQGDLAAAIDSYKQSLKIEPSNADAYLSMGNSLRDQGDLAAAIDSYKQSLKIKPDYHVARAAKLYQQAHICDWIGIKDDENLIPALGISTQKISPFELLALEDSPNRHRLRSEIYAKNDFPQKPLSLEARPVQKPKRLRVGYFSADFHNHATMYLMAKVFETHNSEAFEIYAYSFGHQSNDEMRQRLVKAVDVFKDVNELADQDVAKLVRQDQIDIAVDLKGYTKSSRTGIFAYRSAPIQINYLGYPGTMGADYIDYIIVDKIVVPVEYQDGYSESIIQLPNSYQVNDNTRVISDLPITKSQLGLPESGIVFCCFNNSYKISQEEFNIWMRVLGKVQGSVLWLLKVNKLAEENLRKEAEKRGISGDRLVFAEKIPQREHLARQKLADLFLDTFNYNAHTTASDALWASLPVVTKLGKGFAARVAGSLLNAIGLSELITETIEEYEALILELATNPRRLAALKEKLATNRLSAPLFDTELFTKHLEDAYEQAYQQYFEKKEPKAIYVSN